MKYRLIRSPLGLTSFRNHQIDEVNEDGVTEARDQDRTENEDNNQSKANSIKQSSVDRQSYSLKLKRESKSRDRTGD